MGNERIVRLSDGVIKAIAEEVSSKLDLTEQIRQIVREELAAQAERPEYIGLSDEKKAALGRAVIGLVNDAQRSAEKSPLTI